MHAPSRNLPYLSPENSAANRAASTATAGTPRGGKDGDELEGLERVQEHVGISSASQPGQCIYERENEHLATLRKDSEVFSSERDDLALEAASCLVTADVGDVLLIGPDVFHRTQNMAVSRLALLVEAM